MLGLNALEFWGIFFLVVLLATILAFIVTSWLYEVKRKVVRWWRNRKG